MYYKITTAFSITSELLKLLNIGSEALVNHLLPNCYQRNLFTKELLYLTNQYTTMLVQQLVRYTKTATHSELMNNKLLKLLNIGTIYSFIYEIMNIVKETIIMKLSPKTCI